jgi:hypothetical protein
MSRVFHLWNAVRIMPNTRFDRSVTIHNPHDDHARTVVDVISAAEMLLRRWPVEQRGLLYSAAVQACWVAMKSGKGGCEARRAFLRAARAAHILEESGHRQNGASEDPT